MNSIAFLIQTEIAQAGPISFSRFMELALYAPELGYYEQQKSVGRAGDFYTNVSVGSLFGELLAFQFGNWLEIIGRDQQSAVSNQIVEAGAHDGRLAADILSAMRSQRPNIFENVEYWILEPSENRKEWQKKTLAEFASKVRWFESWNNFPASGINGVIFSNELLDAMPVRRFGWNAREKNWFEWKVGWNGKEFHWIKTETANDDQRTLNIQLPQELQNILPDEFTIETSCASADWWSEAAKKLRHGKLLTFDYGLTQEEFFHPNRSQGTLRAYFQHRASTDLLANVGDQDLTAHVNFSMLQQVGEGRGLTTENLVSQTKFLTQIVEKVSSEPGAIEKWTASQRRQLQTLTHPEHLGRPFRVLIQNRS